MKSKPKISVLAVVGGAAGIVVTGLGILGVRGGGESAIGLLSAGQAQVFLMSMLVLFLVALEAGVTAGRFPKASALALLISGGVVLACCVLAAFSFFYGALFLLPEAFLIFVAGFVAVFRATPEALGVSSRGCR